MSPRQVLFVVYTLACIQVSAQKYSNATIPNSFYAESGNYDLFQTSIEGNLKIRNETMEPMQFSMFDGSVDSIFISGQNTTVRLVDVRTKSLQFEGEYFNPFAFKNKIRLATSSIEADYMELKDVELVNYQDNFSNYRKLTLSKCKFTGRAVITGARILDTLSLIRLDFSNLVGNLTINYFPRADTIMTLYISETDISRLNIQYQNCRLGFSEMDDEEIKIYTYQQLLANFKSKGYLLSYENLDKEFQQYQYLKYGDTFGKVSNWISSYWWDYGYNKILVLRGSMTLFVIFLTINMLFFKHLLYSGYRIDAIANVYYNLEIKYGTDANGLLAAKFPYMILYTCFVFWGIRLDIKGLSVSNLITVFYILIQYISGIICLAYIANLIITV